MSWTGLEGRITGLDFFFFNEYYSRGSMAGSLEREKTEDKGT